MHAMSVLLEGTKVVHLENDEIVFNKKNISLLTQNNYFLSERIVESKTYKALVIYFDDKFILDFIKKYEIDIDIKKQSNIIKISFENNKLLENSIDTFQAFLENKFNNNLLKLKIEEIFLQLIELDKKQVYSFFYAIVSTAQDRIKYILESNIDLIQDLSDMCSLTRLSESKIRTYIKKHFNQTPKVWLDTKRLEKAAFLLTNTQKSISEISTSCGYATNSWFISQFKKYYNLTPKEFKEKNKQN